MFCQWAGVFVKLEYFGVVVVVVVWVLLRTLWPVTLCRCVINWGAHKTAAWLILQAPLRLHSDSWVKIKNIFNKDSGISADFNLQFILPSSSCSLDKFMSIYLVLDCFSLFELIFTILLVFIHLILHYFIDFLSLFLCPFYVFLWKHLVLVIFLL